MQTQLRLVTDRDEANRMDGRVGWERGQLWKYCEHGWTYFVTVHFIILSAADAVYFLTNIWMSRRTELERAWIGRRKKLIGWSGLAEDEDLMLLCCLVRWHQWDVQ